MTGHRLLIKNHGVQAQAKNHEGWTRSRRQMGIISTALQESVFRKDWCAEGGMFGEKGSGGQPPEKVGPMGETM